MDIQRSSSVRRRKIIKKIVFGVVVLLVAAAATVGLYRLKPAAAPVERSSVWLDTVRRGPMVREVRGLGTLLPEDVLWIPAMREGRIERILVKPGATVEPSTVLMVLSNPELQLQSLEAEYQVKAAEAHYADLEVQLQREELNQQAELTRISSEYEQQKLKSERDEVLAKEGLLADLDRYISKSNADTLGQRHQIEQKRVSIQSKSTEAQLAVQRAEIDRLRALARMRRNEVEALTVRAGARGVLQELPGEVGQQVSAGTILARVAQPERLKAELKIPETQVKDVMKGQPVSVDTRNGLIPGVVERIDPAVREGTVTVDVKLTGALPAGARPDLSVEGTVQIERLADVIYVGRPAFGQPNSTVGMFRLEKDGRIASRTLVRLGRSSVNTVEILEGLTPGDQVILSDTSAYDSHDRIELR